MTTNYETLSVKELRSQLKTYGFKGISTLKTKEQLIKALKSVDKDIAKLQLKGLKHPYSLNVEELKSELKNYNKYDKTKDSKMKKPQLIKALVNINKEILQLSKKHSLVKAKNIVRAKNMKASELKEEINRLRTKKMNVSKMSKKELIASYVDIKSNIIPKSKILNTELTLLSDKIDNINNLQFEETPKDYKDLMKQFRKRMENIQKEYRKLKSTDKYGIIDVGKEERFTEQITNLNKMVSYPYSGLVKQRITYRISKDLRTKDFMFGVVNSSENDIIEICKERIRNYLTGIDAHDVKSTFYAGGQLTKFDYKHDFDNMVINEVVFKKLPYDVECNNAIIETHCVRDYLKKVCPTIYKVRAFNKLEKEKGDFSNFKVKDLKEFLTFNNINYYIYDQWMNLRDKNTKYNKKTSLYFICGNNHLYPLTSKEHTVLQKCRTIDAKKFKVNDCKVMEYDDIIWYSKEHIKWFDGVFELKKSNKLNENKLKFRLDRLIYGEGDENTLMVDKDTYKCYQLYKKCGVDVILNYKFNKHSPLFQVAEKFDLYSTNLSTFGNPKALFANEPMYEGMYEREEINNIDKNGCYTDAFRKLTYVPVITSKNITHRITNSATLNVNKYHFYHIYHIGETWIYDYHDLGWCSGIRLKHFKDEIRKGIIKINGYIVPDLIENPYSNIIDEMISNCDKGKTSIVKNLVNVFIGKCQIYKSNGKYSTMKVDRFFTSPEEAPENSIKLSPQLYATYKTIEHTNKYSKNLLPLAHFVIDSAINMIIDKLEELFVEGNITKILRFKTDSIQYTGKLPNDLDKNNLSGWKEEEFKGNKNVIIKNRLLNSGIISLRNKKIEELSNKELDDYIINSNILSDNYAGVGKTYFIINRAIPTIKLHKPNARVLVMAVQHTTLDEYYSKFDKDNNVSVHTFASIKYRMKKSALQEFNVKPFQFNKFDYIFIDEVGLLNFKYWEFLWQNLTWNHKIHAFGDRKQLPPVKLEHSPLLNYNIRHLFDIQLTVSTNYRNNYTNADYDKMINNSYVLTDLEKKIVNRYSYLNVCRYLKTCPKINERYTKDITTSFCGLKVEKGTRIICKTNDLRTPYKGNGFFKGGICNNMMFEVIDFDDNKITMKKLSLCNDNEPLNNTNTFTLNTFQFELGDFIHGYAITLHCAQGSSIPYEKIGIHELADIKKIKGGMYTAFSRIKL